MSDPLVVQSHRGPYEVHFDSDVLWSLVADERHHYVIDRRVGELYKRELAGVMDGALLIEASEESKSLHHFPGYVEHLASRGVRRGQVLVAVGGGVTQDIVCFIAATLLRGLEWHFIPTTLLAQADSCIGSKSSINVGALKNILGTFTPPSRISIDVGVLATLDATDIRSGIGEMLKVHAIDGPRSFDGLAADYDRLQEDEALLAEYVRRSLEIKRAIVERDEFDKGVRNVMNYGHSFGHAIESATSYGIPHGIAVTIGADMANYTAVHMGRMKRGHFDRMHPTFAANYAGHDATQVPLDGFYSAIAKDKKNTASALRLVLPDAEARMELVSCKLDDEFRRICETYFAEEFGR